MTAATPGPPGRGWWSRWARFLDEREPGTTLAVFRFPCGWCVVGGLTDMIARGAVPGMWLGAEHGGFRPGLPAPTLFSLLGGVHPGTVWGMVVVTMLAGALLALGLGGRFTALVALTSFMGLCSLNPMGFGAYDALMTNALWLLVLARSTETLSLDCWLRHRRWTSEALVPAWPRRVAVAQLVLMYWATGLQKVSVHWTPLGDCSALYEIMQQPTWRRWDMTWLAWAYPLTQAATLTVWLWELGSPLLLVWFWLQRRPSPGRLARLLRRIPLRALFVVFGVGMHLTLALFMSIGFFSGLSMAFYVCLFSPEECSAFWNWLRRFLPAPVRQWFGPSPAGSTLASPG